MIRYGAHNRVVQYGGKRRVVRVAVARNWTAADYDLIEKLVAAKLRYKDMLPHFTDPSVTLEALKKAMRSAKIDYPHYKAGRPRKVANDQN